MSAHALTLAEMTSARLAVYRMPIVPPSVQARFGFSRPMLCGSPRHPDAGSPVASWLVMLASVPHDWESAGTRATAVAVFAACGLCATDLDGNPLPQLPDWMETV